MKEVNPIWIQKEIGKVLHNVSKKIDPAQVSLDTALSDLGLDSLDKMEMLCEIENVFKVEIPDAHAAAMKTPGDIVNYIANKRNR